MVIGLDLTERKAEGQAVDSRDIKKHRSDVFRLYQLLSPAERITLPEPIREDLMRFLDTAEREVDDQFLKNIVIREVAVAEVVRALREIYRDDRDG